MTPEQEAEQYRRERLQVAKHLMAALMSNPARSQVSHSQLAFEAICAADDLLVRIEHQS